MNTGKVEDEVIWEFREQEQDILSKLNVETLAQRAIEDSTGLDKLRKLIRKVYSAGINERIDTKEIVGRIPSGISIGQVSLFVERPILWVRPFNNKEFLKQLSVWGLIQQKNSYSCEDSIDTLLEIALKNYIKANKKLGLIVAATGKPEHYSNSPLVISFLQEVSKYQKTVPFGGLRNSFIAINLVGDKLTYNNLMAEGLKKFNNDYYAAFRYAKIKALENVPVLKKSVNVLNNIIGSDPQGIKELYMSIYSSIYGSFLGVHPTLGGQELHPDEKSLSIKSPIGNEIVPTEFGPFGIVMKKRLAVPKIGIYDAIKYGKHIRNAYLKLYYKRDEIIDIDDILEHIPAKVDEVNQKIDLIANSLSFVSLAFQFFTGGSDIVENILSVSSVLYYVFVYYRILQTKKYLRSVFKSFEDNSTTYLNCLIITP